MREFSLVSPGLWLSPSFWALPSDSDRLAYLYVLTGPHQTGAGCYRLPIGYMAADLRWSEEAALIAIGEMVKAGLIEYAVETSEVLLIGWFEIGGVMNASHYTGVKRRIAQIAATRIREAADAAVDAAWAATEAKRAESKLSNAGTQRSLALLSSIRGGKAGK